MCALRWLRAGDAAGGSSTRSCGQQDSVAAIKAHAKQGDVMRGMCLSEARRGKADGGEGRGERRKVDYVLVL